MKRGVWISVASLVLVAGAWVACGPVHRTDGGWGLLPASRVAPEFRAPDQEGRVRTLSEFRGKPVVLFFYPKDGTPGCTREACAFRDAWDKLAATGAQVLGVSGDDVRSHARFAAEHRLPFPLLSDTDGAVMRAYGVRSTLGMASRVTFLIDPNGVVAKVYPDVDPGIHAGEVVRALLALPGAQPPALPAPSATAGPTFTK